MFHSGLDREYLDEITCKMLYCVWENKNDKTCLSVRAGELAQMVERSLSMREVPGSMPGFSTFF